MIPIHEQRHKQGIGHSFESFLRRFVEICQNHLNNNKAKAFALIFYDFNDYAIKRVLRDHGGFTRLDRLSGNDLLVFYVHSNDQHLINNFNHLFRDLFEIHQLIEYPFVLFFKLEDNDAKDIEIAELEYNNIMFAFDELYRTLELYITKLNSQTSVNHDERAHKFIRFYHLVKRIAGEKFLENLINYATEYLGKKL